MGSLEKITELSESEKTKLLEVFDFVTRISLFALEIHLDKYIQWNILKRYLIEKVGIPEDNFVPVEKITDMGTSKDR